MLNSLKTWLRWSDSSNSSVTLIDSQQEAGPEVESLVTEITRLHKNLSSRTDLKPCTEVNTLFGELIELCTQTLSEYVTSQVCKSFYPK